MREKAIFDEIKKELLDIDGTVDTCFSHALLRRFYRREEDRKILVMLKEFKEKKTLKTQLEVATEIGKAINRSPSSILYRIKTVLTGIKSLDEIPYKE